MTNKQVKSIFYVMAVIVMTILVAVSCKKKPTEAQAGNFQIVEVPVSTNETPKPIPPETNDTGIPPSTNETSTGPILPIENTVQMKQFEGLYFESKTYNNGVKDFKYTAKVGCVETAIGIKDPYVEFEDGCRFFSGFQGDYNYNGRYVLLYEGAQGPRNGLYSVAATATFTTNGYLYVKFENYSDAIEYALAKESDK